MSSLPFSGPNFLDFALYMANRLKRFLNADVVIDALKAGWPQSA